MKKIIIITSLFLGAFLLTKCAEKESPLPVPSTDAATMTHKDQVKRGAYLVNAIGCDDCHSPKIMGPKGPEIDPARRMSGHPANQPVAEIADESILKDYVLFSMSQTMATGPWGTSFAANLTPDDTGLGAWTEAQFLKAMKEGKSKGLDGTRPLLPPMPWVTFKNLSDEDLKAIFAYLQTLTPVNNVVPAPIAPAT